MNSAFTSSLLKSTGGNEISTLAGSDEALSGFSGDVFAKDFKAAIEAALSESGKLKPLGFADPSQLEQLDVQQLKDLAGQLNIELPADVLSASGELKQLPLNILALEASAKLENSALAANPNANKLVKEKIGNYLINTESSDEGMLKKSVDTPELLSKTLKTDVLQQSPLKNEPNVLQGLTKSEFDLAQYVKSLNKNDGAMTGELLQTGIKDLHSTKIVEQLSSIDKPVSSITSASNTALPTILEQHKPALMLRRIDVPVNQAAWGETVGNRLLTMVSDKIQTANIQLNPRELGPIEVRINVNQDQASVHFITSNVVVRDAVEEAFPRLREMFMQNGLSLADANVSQQSSQQQGSTHAKEQSETLQTENNNPLENADKETLTTGNETMTVGLVDQYV